MKSSLTGNTVNDRQWETVVLTKRSKPQLEQSKQQSQRVLSDEEKVERHKPITKILQQQIIQARTTKKLTQKQLAGLANIDINAIKEYETGKRIFCEAEVKKLEKALQCKLQRK